MNFTKPKIGVALVLLSSLALPQATCSGYRAPNGDFVTSVPVGAPQFRFGDASTWLDLGVFLWPLPLLAIGGRARHRGLGLATWFMELVLALGAVWYVWFSATLFVRPAIGAYLAIGALAGYVVVWTLEAWSRTRARRFRTAGA